MHDVQPFTGAAELSGFLVFVIKYVRFYSIDTIYEKNQKHLLPNFVSNIHASDTCSLKLAKEMAHEM